MRKIMHCRGTVQATGEKCSAVLCETDGESIFLRLESGRELKIVPKRKRAFSFVCDVCGYETFWEKAHNG